MCLLAADEFAQALVADHLLAVFIPEAIAERLEASEQRDGFHLLENRNLVVSALQIVVRDARAEVVDVVEANIAGEPLKDARQFVERAALKRGGCVVPLIGAFPIDALILMLNVEHPHPDRAADHRDGELDLELGPNNAMVGTIMNIPASTTLHAIAIILP